MYRKIAMALTVFFQPLVVPSIVIAILFYVIPEATSVPKEAQWSILLLIMVTTLLIPMISVIGMRMTTMIPSMHMVTKRERVLPFSMVSLFYLMTSSFFYFKLYVDSLLVYTLIVITACVIALTITSLFWRISAHMTGLAGLLAIVIVLELKFTTVSLLYPVIASVMLCGVVSSARLYLNAHRPMEVFGGFLLGFSVCFISLYYFLF